MAVSYQLVKVDDFAVSNVTSVKMVLIHLLWFLYIGRIVIKDIDTYYVTVLLHLHIEKFEQISRLYLFFT